jgi:phosphoglycolate phosphatase-like HAD superfamily hydrolase
MSQSPTAMLPWNEIDTVLLDMDGTLLDLHFDSHFWLEYLPACYARHHGQTLEWAKAEIYGIMNARRGQLEWYCLDYWTRSRGFERSIARAVVQSTAAEESPARRAPGRGALPFRARDAGPCASADRHEPGP